MKTMADFSGFVVGDLVTLSDMQTQEEYSKMTVDFPIREVRTYVEPNGVFTYIGYIVETPEKQQLLILVKTMGSDFEIYVFYMDTGAALYQAEAGQDPCALLCLLTADQKDLIKRIEAQITGKNGTHPVTWDLQTVTHGVQYNDTTGVEGICTLGEYFTNDPNDGNSFCMVDWKGDAAKGFLEIWYGCLIKNHEIQLFHK